MKRVLVTGSNGFIGSHVASYLRKKGYYVIGLGRSDISKNELDDYVCCDLATDKVNQIFEILKVDKIDAMIHLAADMRHEPFTTEVVGANCVGTQKLLELCEKKNVPVFVQLSSLPVIGKPAIHPITEEHPLAPPTVYHVTKRTQELLANYADYTFGLRTVSFRISAPIGKGMNPKTIFPVFVNKALRNEDLLLSGKGTRKQTYVHVLDIAQAIEKAIISNAHGVYNLASYNLLSNYELAKKCIEITNSTSKIVYTGKDDPMDNYIWDVSLDKIKKEIGYEPQISIDMAIKEYASILK